jgi:hypothetical protein
VCVYLWGELEREKREERGIYIYREREREHERV